MCFELNLLNLLKKKIKINHEYYNIILPGGSSLKKFYNLCSKDFFFRNKRINYILSDERDMACLDRNNLNMLKKNFLNSYNKNITYFNLKLGSKKKIIRNFNEKIKNKKIDLIILSYGKNSHIASIFDQSIKYINLNYASYNFINELSQNRFRFTITKKVLSKSKAIIIILSNKDKILEFLDQLRLQNNSVIQFLLKLGNKCQWVVEEKHFHLFDKVNIKPIILKI